MKILVIGVDAFRTYYLALLLGGLGRTESASSIFSGLIQIRSFRPDLIILYGQEVSFFDQILRNYGGRVLFCPFIEGDANGVFSLPEIEREVVSLAKSIKSSLMEEESVGGVVIVR